MNKLPVFKTTGQVFGFVVERRFFTLLRLVWFPSLLAMIFSILPAIYVFAKYGTVPQKFEHQIVGVKVNLEVGADPVIAGLDLLNFIASMLLGAIVAVSIHRLILLDDRKPGTFFNLRLTGQEWLYILAWILYFVVMMLAFAPIYGHLLYSVHGQLQSLPWNDPEAVSKVLAPALNDPRTAVAFGLSILFMFVVLVRFGLVFPIIVAENRLSFGRSWVLTRGNFWRLILFWILVIILGFILLMVMMAIIVFAVAAMFGSVLLGGQTVGALGILVFIVPAAVAFLVYFVIAVAIFVAALSFSYRALAGPRAQEAEFE